MNAIPEDKITKVRQVLYIYIFKISFRHYASVIKVFVCEYGKLYGVPIKIR
jgi:hypothetical protein